MVDLNERVVANEVIPNTVANRSIMLNKQPKVAVMFFGNMGVGKSMLLSQLGGRFVSRFAMLEGVTKIVEENEVDIEGQRIVLVDTPGLYEYDDKSTKANCKILTKAFKKDYYYKLFFVVESCSRVISPEDLALMARVNEAICQVDGSKVEFGIIINKIRGDAEFYEYKQRATPETLEHSLGKLGERTKALSFKIKIKSVLLLKYDENAVEHNLFHERLVSEVMNHTAVRVKVKAIHAVSNDINLLWKITEGILIGIVSSGVVAGIALKCAPIAAAAVLAII
ncbi:hypothetical protein BGW38_006437 [Lunasporangiospora selenospora]|uniref:G domain-containing protein n=1 Tax=Lunasporangiospora selenospora TaxID=979761 RepID=A0A9P6FZH5_9FUNG|nr:hypothetical protein BGW38_006437 [Lunasporangiospora selenospora]